MSKYVELEGLIFDTEDLEKVVTMYDKHEIVDKDLTDLEKVFAMAYCIAGENFSVKEDSKEVVEYLVNFFDDNYTGNDRFYYSDAEKIMMMALKEVRLWEEKELEIKGEVVE